MSITAKDIERLNAILAEAYRPTVSLEDWIGRRSVRGSGLAYLTLAPIDYIGRDLGGVACETCGCALADHIAGKPCTEPLS